MPPGDMPIGELRRYAHEIADWIADFLDHIEERPVLSPTRPGELTARLSPSPPTHGEDMGQILADFYDQIVPASTQWNHPGFHALFANTASGPGILAEALTAALNANAMMWRTAPAATEVEDLTLDWLRQMLGLPKEFRGHINDTASVGTLVALAAARHRCSNGAVREQGVRALEKPVIYCSVEAHSSVDKAAILLGLGSESLHKIPTDSAFRMDVDALSARIADDRAQGCTPVAVVAVVGTTSTTAIDPVAAIADVCEREGIFLHVDAAYGGAMAVHPDYRYVLDGCHRADSFVVNPHKWLFVPMDCSCLYVKDVELLRQSFSLVPPYLMSPEHGEARDLMDYGPALGRRFRALKLWMVLRYFGSEGVAERVAHHVRLAGEFRDWVEAEKEWKLMAPASMGLVLCRHEPAGMDEVEIAAHNARIMEAVNANGRSFLSHTLVGGERYALRVAVGNLRTQRRHLENLWSELKELTST